MPHRKRLDGGETSRCEDIVAARPKPAPVNTRIADNGRGRYDESTAMVTLPAYAHLWLQQWRAAGSALAEHRRRELEVLTDAGALAAATELLAIAPACSPDDPRWHTSGLVELQRLLRTSR